MAHRTFRRFVAVLLAVTALVFGVYSLRGSPAPVHAEAADFLVSGAITPGKVYEFKVPGNSNSIRRVAKRVTQGWVEVDAWTIDPGLPPLEPVPRRWLNASAMEYIQEVPERR